MTCWICVGKSILTWIVSKKKISASKKYWKLNVFFIPVLTNLEELKTLDQTRKKFFNLWTNYRWWLRLLIIFSWDTRVSPMKRIFIFLNENNITFIFKRQSKKLFLYPTNIYHLYIFEEIRLCYIAYACLSKNKIAKQ